MDEDHRTQPGGTCMESFSTNFTQDDLDFLANCRSNFICVYCGEPSEARDHFIPHSAMTVKRRKSFAGDNIVSSCKECNTLKSNKVFGSLSEAREYLYYRIIGRGQQLLKAVEWTDAELLTIEGSVRAYVKQAELKRRRLHRRLDFIRNLAS